MQTSASQLYKVHEGKKNVVSTWIDLEKITFAQATFWLQTSMGRVFSLYHNNVKEGQYDLFCIDRYYKIYPVATISWYRGEPMAKMYDNFVMLNRETVDFLKENEDISMLPLIMYKQGKALYARILTKKEEKNREKLLANIPSAPKPVNA